VTVPSPDRSGETPFSDLEKDFFASAPPEVAQPAPEPMRFDDLVPIEAPRPAEVATFRREIPTGARRALNAASTARASFARWLDQAGRRVRPGLASFKGRAATIASTASRRSRGALAAASRGSRAAFVAARTASAHTRAGARRLVGLLAAHRRFAVAVAIAVVVVTGVSVSVGLASRGGSAARAPVATAPAPATPAPAISAPVAPEPAPSPTAGPTVLAQAAPAETPAAPVETQPTPVETQPAPVETAPATPALEPRPSSTSEAPASHAAAPKPAHAHRRHPTYSSRTDLLVPSFMTAPKQEAVSRPAPASAPALANRPAFSR
jgi:hypothetical protein